MVLKSSPYLFPWQVYLWSSRCAWAVGRSGGQRQGAVTMVYNQLMAKLKSRIQIRNLLARQCLAEFLGEFVLMVGRVLGEGTRRGANVLSAAWCPASCRLRIISRPLHISPPSYPLTFIPVPSHLLPSFPFFALLPLLPSSFPFPPNCSPPFSGLCPLLVYQIPCPWNPAPHLPCPPPVLHPGGCGPECHQQRGQRRLLHHVPGRRPGCCGSHLRGWHCLR